MKKVFFLLVFIFLINCATTGLKKLSAEATATSRDYQIALDKATQDARVEIAQQLNTYIQGLIKKFDKEVGITKNSELLGLYSKTSKTVVDQSVIGSQIKKKDVKKEGSIYRTYILMEAPLGQARQKLVEQIRSSEPLYQRFKSSQSFKNIEDEFER